VIEKTKLANAHLIQPFFSLMEQQKSPLSELDTLTANCLAEFVVEYATIIDSKYCIYDGERMMTCAQRITQCKDQVSIARVCIALLTRDKIIDVPYAKQIGAFLLTVIARTNSDCASRQLALDHLDIILQIQQQQPGFIPITPLLIAMLSDAKAPLDNVLVLTEHSHAQQLLDCTPLPRDIANLCTAYARVPRLDTAMLVRIILRDIALQPEERDEEEEEEEEEEGPSNVHIPRPLSPLIIRLLQPSSVASSSMLADVLNTLSTSDAFRASIKHTDILSKAFAVVDCDDDDSDNDNSTIRDDTAYWQAWFACGFLDALCSATLWVRSFQGGKAIKFSTQAPHTLQLLLALAPLEEPRIHTILHTCFHTILAHAPKALDELPRPVRGNMCCARLQASWPISPFHPASYIARLLEQP
jgi:hypothetical protein